MDTVLYMFTYMHKRIKLARIYTYIIYIYINIHMYYKRKNEPLCILDIGYIFASINICKDNR